MKFKPGDKVRICEDISTRKDGPTVNSAMGSMGGDVFTVKEYTFPNGRLQVEENSWIWSEDWLSLVEQRHAFCFVRHDGSDKEFAFDCSDVDVELGMRVVVDTMYGETHAQVFGGPCYITCDQTTFEYLLGLLGAYFPLKKVLREYNPPKLTEEERRAVALEWLKEQHSPTPF